MAQSNLEVLISARDQFSATANRITGSLNRMQAAAGRVGKGVGQVGAGLARVAVIGATATAGALAFVARETIGLQSAMAGVNKTMDLTPDELKEIERSIRSLSTQIPLGTTELAGLVEQAGALGIAKQDVVEFARVAATIGVTTNVAAGDAATALGTMSNLLGLVKDDYQRFASTLVDLGNKGASTEAQILAIAERAAGAGATVGLAAQDVLGFASAVANIAMEPEAGGTSLQRFFIDTLSLIHEGGEDLTMFAKTAGKSAKDIKTAFANDPASVLRDFVIGLSKLDQAGRLNVLDKLGWDDIRVGRMFLGLAEAEKNTSNLADALDIARDAWRKNTAAAEEADKRYGTVESKLQLLKAQFLEGVHVIGEGFLPALGRVADKLKAILGDEHTRNDLKKFGEDIGKFLDDIDWAKVSEGARTFAGVLRDAAGYAKGVVDMVNALPDQVKAAGAAFIGLNQLSGGLIGTGLGNIAGGLGSVAARSVASRLPGVGSLFAQPVFVTNWPMGGIGAPGTGTPVPTGGGGITTPKIGAGIVLGPEVWKMLSPSDPSSDLNTKIRPLFEKPVDEMKYALVSEAQQTENLLRANLTRPQPIPQVTVTVNVSPREVTKTITTANRYGPTSDSYYGGSPAPTYSH